MLFGCVSLFAQTRHYRVRFAPEGQSVSTILINDSEKAIEAYSVSSRCQSRGAGPRIGDEFDILTIPEDSGEIHRSKKDVVISSVEPGGQRRLGAISGGPLPTGCEWTVESSGVIYADGTYEGDESVVRNLQARRDGVAASVKFWSDRFGQTNSGAPNASVTADEAMQLIQRDMAKTMELCSHQARAREFTLTCEYWRGRTEPDSSLQAMERRFKDGPEERDIAGVFDKWEKKIEGDMAMNKVGAVFPVPAEVPGRTDPTARSAGQPGP